MAEEKKVVAEKVTETVKKAEKDVKTVAAKAKETAETAVKEVKAAAKTPAKKAAAVKKAPAKKAAAPKKAPAKRTAAKKAEPKTNVVLQYAGKEVVCADLLAKVDEIWASKNKTAAPKDVKVYVKPEENTAYYVINDGEEIGSFAI